MGNNNTTNIGLGLDSKSAGVRNERLVLSLLRKHGSLSQAQLRELGGIQSSTASYIVGRLRDKGLIVEEQGKSKKRGKKPTLLHINPHGGFIVGIEINPSYVYIGLFDFKCELIESVKAVIGDDRSPEHVSQTLEINLRGLLAKSEISEERVLGVGVALSGSITKDGVVKLASPLGWKNVRLGEMLERRLSWPVSVYTTRVRLLAEDYLHKAALPDKKHAEFKGLDSPWLTYSNVLYINVGNGVGGNVICDGNMVHGATNRAAEIGHIVIDPNGPLCGCGNKGCLEAFVSGPAIARRLQSDIQSGQETSLKDALSRDDLPEDIVSKWGEAIAQGDHYAVDLQAEVTRHLCWAAMISINCYDPGLVILAGYVVEQFTDHLIDAMIAAMSSQVYDSVSRQIKVVAARGGKEALIRGAGLAVFYKIS